MKTTKLTGVELAESIARKAHEGQTRFDGSPYIAHPERVAACFDEPVFKEVAWLHDVLEDTPMTPRELLALGVSGPVVDVVQVLTRRVASGETYEAFINRIAGSGWESAKTLKIADILDNLSDQPSKNQVRKYAAALKRLLFQ